MSEIDDISARLTVIETVVRQLITHFAIRADNPSRWVEARKVLAMSAIARERGSLEDGADRMREAVASFFDQAEMVATEYRLTTERGTPRPFVR